MYNRYTSRISTDTNLSLDYDTYLITPTTSITLTLPDMTGISSGTWFTLRRIDLNQNINVKVVATGTTIDNTDSVLINAHADIIITYDNGVWNIIEESQPNSYDYSFDYVYINGTPSIYSAFEDIMDIVTLTCYDDAAMLCKINSFI